MLNKGAIFNKLSLVANANDKKEARFNISGYKNFLRFQVFLADLTSNDKAKMVAHIPVNRVGMEILVKELEELNTKEDNYTFV